MKYLITGLTGFAGPHLANLLIKNGHQVFGLSRRTNGMETDILDTVDKNNFDKINWIYGDLQNQNLINKIISEHQFDGVFHLAAQSHPPTSFIDPLGTMQANVIGSANLIQAITDYSSNTRLMFCSTSEVYGDSIEEGQKINENFVIKPSNPYGVSKAATDLYMQERMTNKKLRGFITRAFSHTGPRRGKIFSISSDAYQIAKFVLNPEEPRILKVGNLESIRVVLDVRDIVNAYYLLMLNPDTDGQVFNVCGDTPRKMGEYTNMLINATNLGVDSITKEICHKLYRPIDIHYQNGDCNKLVYYTGWKPEIDIQTTMFDLIKYWVNKLKN